MDCIVHGVAKSWMTFTVESDFHVTFMLQSLSKAEIFLYSEKDAHL